MKLTASFYFKSGSILVTEKPFPIPLTEEEAIAVHKKVMDGWVEHFRENGALQIDHVLVEPDSCSVIMLCLDLED